MDAARPAGAEGLEHGFFGGEAAGIVLRGRLAGRAILDLVRRIDPRQKQLAVPLDHLGYAEALDDVGPDADDGHGFSIVERGARGSPAGQLPACPAHWSIRRPRLIIRGSTEQLSGAGKNMKIHEYQAKELFRKSGVAVLKGKVAASPEEAAAAFKELGGPLAVVKAQIHAGGRGKGTVKSNPQQRGVQLVRSEGEAATVAKNLLGKELVTIQTGPEGKTVNRVFVEEGCQIARELYLGIVLDRAAARPVLMVSSEGGVEIEKVAAETPHLIFKEHFDPHVGLLPYQVRKLCYKLNLKGPSVASAEKFMRALCRMYVKLDCSLCAIMWLVVYDSVVGR